MNQERGDSSWVNQRKRRRGKGLRARKGLIEEAEKVNQNRLIAAYRLAREKREARRDKGRNHAVTVLSRAGLETRAEPGELTLARLSRP